MSAQIEAFKAITEVQDSKVFDISREIEEEDVVRHGDLVYFDNEEITMYGDNIMMRVIGYPKSKPIDAVFLNTTFKIQPKFEYSAKKEYFRYLQAEEHDPNELRRLQESYELEQSTNKQEELDLSGKAIFYGQIVQLVHYGTNTFVVCDPNESAELDTTGLKLILQKEGNKYAWFKIMSPHKVRFEGEKVRKGDRIVLINEKTGQSLHTSEEKFPDSDLKEINCFSSRTAFVVNHYAPYVPKSERFLKGGDVVRIFHQEVEGFLKANLTALFGDKKYSVYAKKVGRGKRHETRSSNALFQIELKNASKGGLIPWNTECRFRHMGTEKFLALGESTEKEVYLYLTRDVNEPTLFTFHPVDKGENYITFGSFFRIKHSSQKTGGPERWLHVGDFIDDPSHDSSPFKFSYSRKKFMAVTFGSYKYEDVLAFKRVEQRKVDDLITANGLYAVIIEFVKKLKHSKEESKFPNAIDAEPVKHVLVSIMRHVNKSNEKNPLKINGIPVPDYQTLLFEQNFLEKTVEILQYAFGNSPEDWKSKPEQATKTFSKFINKQQYDYMKTLCTYIYKFLQLMVKNNLKLGNYIVKWLDLFLAQLSSIDTIREMLIELFKDNFELLNNIPEENIVAFIRLILESGRDPRLLEFLQQICTCNGVPIVRNQNIILKNIEKHFELIIETRFSKEKGTCEVNIGDMRNEQWIGLEDFIVGEPQDKKKDPYAFNYNKKNKKLIEYFKQMLALFYKLAIGGNEKAISIISRDGIPSLKKEPLLSPDEVLICMTNEKLSGSLRAAYTDLMYLWVDNDLPPSSDIVDVKITWSWEELKEDYRPANKLSESMVEGEKWLFSNETVLKEFLVKYVASKGGMICADKESSLLILSVLSLTEKLVRYGFFSSPEWQSKLIPAMVDMLDGTNDEPKGPSRYEMNELSLLIMQSKLQITKIFHIFYNLQLEKRVAKRLFLFKQSEIEEENQSDAPRKKKKNKTSDYDIELVNITNKKEADAWVDNQKFITILLDVMFYDYELLSTSVLSLLFRHMKPHDELCDTLEKVQLLVDDQSTRVYNIIKQKMGTLLVLMKDNDVSPEEMPELLEIVRTLIKLCCAKEDLSKPSVRNQTILRNMGVHDEILRILRMPWRKEYHQLWKLCYLFLKQFCSQNKTNQILLIPHLEFYLSQMGYKLNIADFLEDLFHDNYHIVSHIETHFIQHMVSLLAGKGRKRKYLQLLSSITEAEGQTIKNHQNQVINMIFAKKDKILFFWHQLNRKKRKMLLDAEKSKNPRELSRKLSLKDLERTQSRFFQANRITLEDFEKMEKERIRDDDEEDLMYHVQMIELLARCCMGYNHVPEVLCQNLVPISVIWEILHDKNNDPFVKLAYCKLMNECWFFTERQIDLTKDDNMWKLLQVFYDELKQYFEKRQLIFDSYHHGYVFDGILLIIKTFFSNQFNPTELKSEQKNLCQDIFDLLCNMLPVYKEDILRLPLLAVVVEKLRESGLIDAKKLEEFAEILEKARTKMGTMTRDSIKAMKAEHLKEQRTLNDFRLFIRKVANIPDSRSRQGVPLRITEFERIVRLFSDNLTIHPQYTQRLIAQLKQSKQNSKDLQLDCIDMLRNMIDLPFKFTDSFTEEERREAAAEREKIQNILCDLNALEAALDLLESSDSLIVHRILLLCTSLFAGGNKKFQARMMKIFLDSSDPHFFDDIHNRILHEIKTLKQKRTSQLAERRSILRIDSDEGMNAFQESPEMQESDGGFTLLNFLQNICEGHFTEMKHYLRDQPDNTKSFNIIKETALFVFEIQRGLNNNLPLANQLFRTINEFASGCPENQLAIMESKIIIPINNILMKYPQADKVELVKVKISIFELLNSLVEGEFPGRQSKTSSIPVRMLTTLNWSAVITNIEQAWEHRKKIEEIKKKKSPLDFDLNPLHMTGLFGNAEQPEEDDGSAAEEFISQAAMLMKLLADFDKGRIGLAKMLSQRKDKHKSDWTDFVSRNIGAIEILNVEGSIEKVFFRVPEICRNLTDEAKENLMKTVSRDSPTEKIEDFVERSTVLNYEIQHQTKIKNTPVLRQIIAVSNISGYALIVLTFIMNLLILIFYIEDETSDNPIIINEPVNIILRICSTIHILLSMFFATTYIANHAPVVVFKKKRDNLEKLRKQNAILEKLGKEPKNYTLPTHLIAPLQDVWIVYYGLYFIFSFIGAFWFPLYSLHLLDMSLRAPAVQNVLKAVTVNGKSILLTALLALTVIYVYSIAAFWFLRYTYDESEGLDCISQVTCLLSTFYWGIRSGGGIGDATSPLNYRDDDYAAKFVFDVTFFIIIIIILLNVVFGIILDTFGSLRDERNEIEEDIRTRCFICSIQSDVFNRQALGFEHHIKNEHNLWKYLYFLIYLDQKDKDEYTSVEEYVNDMKEAGEISYFPINRAIALEHTEYGQKKA